MFKRTSALCLLVLASMGAACAVPTTAQDALDAPTVASDLDLNDAVEPEQQPDLSDEGRAPSVQTFSMNPFDVAWNAISMFVVDPLVGYVKGKGDEQIMDFLPFADAKDSRLATLTLKMDALLAAQTDMKSSLDGLRTELHAHKAFATAHNHHANLIGYMAPITVAEETSSTAGLSYYLSGKPAKSSRAQLERDMQTFIRSNSQVEMSRAMSSMAGIGKAADYFPEIARYAALTRGQRSNFESMQLLQTAYLNIAMRQTTALKLMAQRDQFIVHLKNDNWEAEHRIFDDGMGGGVQADYLTYMRDVGEAYISASASLAGMLSGDSANNTTNTAGNVVLDPQIGQGLALAVATARSIAGESGGEYVPVHADRSTARVVVLSRGNDNTLGNDKTQSAIRFVSGSAQVNGTAVALGATVANSLVGKSGTTCLSGTLMRTEGDAKGDVRLELTNAWRLTEVTTRLPKGASKAKMVLSVNGQLHNVDVTVSNGGDAAVTTPSGYGFLDLRFAGRAANALREAQPSTNMFLTTWSTFGNDVLRDGKISASAASLTGGDANAGADQWVRLNVKVNNDIKGAKVWNTSRGSVSMLLQHNPYTPTNAWRNECNLKGDEQRTSTTSMITFGDTVLFGQKGTFASHGIPSAGCTKNASFVYKLSQPMDGETTYAKRNDLARQVRTAHWAIYEKTVDLSAGSLPLTLDAGYNNIRGLEGDPRRRFVESDVQLGAFNVFVESSGV